MERVSAVTFLCTEYARRRADNPNYSLRSFAAKLNMGSGPLSEILRGKRKLSRDMGERLAKRLSLKYDHEANEFMAPRTDESFHALNEDAFSVIADWYYYAILSLIETKDFTSSASWIGRRLGISPREARLAIEKLKRLGLIKVNGGKLVRTKERLTTSDGTLSRALQLAHRQSLERAIGAIEMVPVHLRNISSLTFPMDTDRLPEAVTLLKEFRRKFLSLMERGTKKEVYQLQLCLFPLSTLGE